MEMRLLVGFPLMGNWVVWKCLDIQSLFDFTYFCPVLLVYGSSVQGFQTSQPGELKQEEASHIPNISQVAHFDGSHLASGLLAKTYRLSHLLLCIHSTQFIPRLIYFLGIWSEPSCEKLCQESLHVGIKCM